MEWSLPLLEYTGHCFSFLENVLLLLGEDKEQIYADLPQGGKKVMIKLIVSSSRNRDKAVKK
jgi:hypothetical protein